MTITRVGIWSWIKLQATLAGLVGLLFLGVVVLLVGVFAFALDAGADADGQPVLLGVVCASLPEALLHLGWAAGLMGLLSLPQVLLLNAALYLSGGLDVEGI